ncbi:hypothetical protein CV014_08255 [Nostoc sp. CMAA1605]|nr:hypothetical protein [Nostoc sp. CMAA1605]
MSAVSGSAAFSRCLVINSLILNFELIGVLLAVARRSVGAINHTFYLALITQHSLLSTHYSFGQMGNFPS